MELDLVFEESRVRLEGSLIQLHGSKRSVLVELAQSRKSNQVRRRGGLGFFQHRHQPQRRGRRERPKADSADSRRFRLCVHLRDLRSEFRPAPQERPGDSTNRRDRRETQRRKTLFISPCSSRAFARYAPPVGMFPLRTMLPGQRVRRSAGPFARHAPQVCASPTRRVWRSPQPPAQVRIGSSLCVPLRPLRLTPGFFNRRDRRETQRRKTLFISPARRGLLHRPRSVVLSACLCVLCGYFFSCRAGSLARHFSASAGLPQASYSRTRCGIAFVCHSGGKFFVFLSTCAWYSKNTTSAVA